MRRFILERHNKHIDCLFFDYSAERVEFKKLWLTKWHRTFDLKGNLTGFDEVTY